MLTATYSQVAIEAEQSMVQRMIEKVHHFIHVSWKAAASAHHGWMEIALQGLRQFNEVYQARKVDRHVIPVLAEKSGEAGKLITDLRSLNAQCSELLQSSERQFSQARRLVAFPTQDACMSMDVYCNKVLIRLTRERQELFPLARRALSVEDWFGIAAKILSEQDSSNRRDSSINDWIPPASAARVLYAH